MHTLELASSGRAKCRACQTLIPKDTLRFGERGPNPYGEGEATWWFHPACGALKRAEAFATLSDQPQLAELARPELLAWAQRGVKHPRLERLGRAQQAKSGRARCRGCRALIEKSLWRVAIDIWEDGRFAPLGWLHAGCIAAYADVDEVGDITARVLEYTPDLSEEHVEALRAALGERRGNP